MKIFEHNYVYSKSDIDEINKELFDDFWNDVIVTSIKSVEICLKDIKCMPNIDNENTKPKEA